MADVFQPIFPATASARSLFSMPTVMWHSKSAMMSFPRSQWTAQMVQQTVLGEGLAGESFFLHDVDRAFAHELVHDDLVLLALPGEPAVGLEVELEIPRQRHPHDGVPTVLEVQPM